MKTIQINLYKFNELSEDAQENALSNLWDINVDYKWWDLTYDDAAEIGLKITGFDIDRANYCNGEFTLSAAEVAANIISSHGENCDTYKTASDFLAKHEPIFAHYLETEEGEDELLELENDFLQSLCEDYKTMLSNEYDYLTSEQAIKDTIEANDYDFTEDGEIA